MTDKKGIFQQAGYDKERANLPVTRLELYVLLRMAQSASLLKTLTFLAKGDQKTRVQDEAKKSEEKFEELMLGLITNKGTKVVDRSDEQ